MKLSTLRPRLFREDSRGLFVSLEVNAKQDLQLDLYNTLLKSFQFIVHQSSYHSTEHNLSY